MLGNLLTEQRNPASRRHRPAPAPRRCCASSIDEDATVAAAVAPRPSRDRIAVDRTADALAAGGRLFYIGAGTSGRLGVLDASECPPTFSVSRDLVQGIMAGGEAALAHSTEASEDDAHERRTRPARTGLHRPRRAGRHRRQRPHALRARRGARAHAAGGLTAGISCSPDSELSRRGRDPHRAAGGTRGHHRIDPDEGRHGHQAGAEHDQHRRS